MLTDLVLYLSKTNNAVTLPTARDILIAAPAAEGTVTNKTGQSTGWGELRSQGNAGAWAAAAAQPAPSGYGWIWDVTTLEGERIAAGLWRPTIKLATSSGTVTATIYLRLYKFTAGGTYELICSAVAPGTAIATGAPVSVVLPATPAGLMDFDVGDKLYLDLILNITLNTSGDAAATTTVYEHGGVAEQVLAPGYDDTPAMAADTVLDLITDALVELNAIQQGDTLSAEDADVGLRSLNSLIDRTNADRLCLNAIKHETKALTAHKGDYTIGRSASAVDFAEDRPILIQTASILFAGLTHNLDLNTAIQWAAIREKTNEAILPTALYCDYRWPVATLNFNPIPLCNAATYLDFYFWEPLARFGGLTEAVALPPAYRDFLKYNLALRLALPFQKQPSQLLVQYAVNAKADVRAFNAQQLAGMVGESTTGQIPQAPIPAMSPLNQGQAPPPQPPQG